MPEPFVLEFAAGSLVYGIAGERDGNRYHVQRGAYIGMERGSAFKKSTQKWSGKNFIFRLDDTSQPHLDPQGWAQYSYNACLDHWRRVGRDHG